MSEEEEDDKSRKILSPCDGEITEIKVRVGMPLSKGKLLGVISGTLKLKAKTSGRVLGVLVEKGSRVKKGDVLFQVAEGCSHPTVMKDMCAECGADLRELQSTHTPTTRPAASIAMVHSIPELKVNSDEAQNLGREDEKRLLKYRKLALLVDLDQTLIHTTNDNIAPNMKDVYHFQLYGPQSPWYHTRIRPRTMEFLESISKYYELHICTFGARMYAHTIAGFLDPDSKYFSHRILSRDESFNNRSKTANLSALFPCGDHMVCIIDDREDVWNYSPNLIHVKPYHFFKHTGDINAPPGSSDEKIDNNNKVSDQNTSIKETPNETDKDEEEVQVVDKEVKKEDKAIKNMERRESIDMPVLDDNTNDGIVNKDDAVSVVSDDLELSDEDSLSFKDSKILNAKDDKKTEIEDLDSDDEDEQKNIPFEAVSSKKNEDDLIEIEDHDDYLHHLEDILITIHKAYYDLFDQMDNNNESPDLKTVVPYVKRKVLQGTSLVFSGVFPTSVKLETSKAYMVAKSLGAKVTNKLENPGTTHLIAAKYGTAKVNESRKIKGIHIVTPDWLWNCAERWERCEEKLFPLKKSGGPPVTLRPPPHCSGSPDFHIEKDSKLPEAMNPFLAFSSEDLKGMDKEIDDILSGESSSSSSEETENEVLRNPSRKRKRSQDEDDAYDRFRAGKTLPQDFDVARQSDDNEDEEIEQSEDVIDEEEEEEEDANEEDDDANWNSMGKELEREFLGDDDSLFNL
ncbi:RNA polymerase II subunit A C-terminal domain phosphatase [Lepeophtheirus salmonis]|uniref:RNA polymerase II subunit A C-terminal domain phosphatase n=1 Tax=Lepeophtheirus salmonis TaxID=72036 RepID=A0A0K2UNY2_LEPSM|nr:RNA polymerase II subunit A C-terminal domain phosphatase-like [Lepeophtheirus salmonis]